MAAAAAAVAVAVASTAAASVPPAPFVGAVSIVAGDSKSSGYGDGAGLLARFKYPVGLTLRRDEKAGTESVLIADAHNSRFRERHSDGRITTFAGSAKGVYDGALLQCAFDMPTAICADPTNPNRFFACDKSSIRVIELAAGGGGGSVKLIAGGWTTGMADGAGLKAKFNHLMSITCSRDGSTLRCCDRLNGRIRALDVKSGVVSTVCGDGNDENVPGIALKSSLYNPRWMTFDRTTAKPETVCFIACHEEVMRFDLTTGVVEKVVIDLKSIGIANISPYGLDTLPNGTLVMSCGETKRIYAVQPRTGAIAVLAGSGVHGAANGNALTEATFGGSCGLVVLEREGCVLIADSANNCLRSLTLSPEVCPRSTTGSTAAVFGATNATAEVDQKSALITGGLVTTAAGDRAGGVTDGAAGVARFYWPAGLSSRNGELAICDRNNHKLRLLAAGKVSSLCGSGREGIKHGSLTEAEFVEPRGVAADPIRPNRWYVCDRSTVRCVDTGTGTVSLIAGAEAGYADGTGSAARFDSLCGVVCTRDGRTLYVCDQNRNNLRSINIESGAVTTVAGSGDRRNTPGVGLNGSIWQPRYAAFDKTTAKPDSVLFVSCQTAIMRFDIDSKRLTSVPIDPKHKLNPFGLDAVSNGLLVISCTLPHSVFFVEPQSGAIERIAGDVSGGYADGAALTEAKFAGSSALTIDESRSIVHYADAGNNCIRQIPLPLTSQFVPKHTPATTTAASVTVTATAAAVVARLPSIRSPSTSAVGVPILTSASATDAKSLSTATAAVSSPQSAAFGAVSPETVLVSTETGHIQGGYNDGIGKVARYDSPCQFVVLPPTATDDISQPNSSTLLITDRENGRIRQRAADGRVITVAGNGESGFGNGGALTSAFDAPRGICADPRNSNRWYIADKSSIRVLDRSSGTATVLVLAGQKSCGFSDRSGENAKFNGLYGLLASSDGSMLYACDMSNNRVRAIHIESGRIRSYGDGLTLNMTGEGPKTSLHFPRFVAFDKTTSQPESVLYATCMFAIVRIVLTTGELTAVPPDPKLVLNPFGIDTLPNGMLIVASLTPNGVYSVDPKSGRTERIAGSGYAGMWNGDPLKEAKFGTPSALVILSKEKAALLADSSNHCIRRLPLPGRLFPAASVSTPAVAAAATAAAVPASVSGGGADGGVPPPDWDCELCLRIPTNPVRFCGACKRLVCRACADQYMASSKYQSDRSCCFCNLPNAPPYIVLDTSPIKVEPVLPPTPKDAPKPDAKLTAPPPPASGDLKSFTHAQVMEWMNSLSLGAGAPNLVNALKRDGVDGSELLAFIDDKWIDTEAGNGLTAGRFKKILNEKRTAAAAAAGATAVAPASAPTSPVSIVSSPLSPSSASSAGAAFDLKSASINELKGRIRLLEFGDLKLGEKLGAGSFGECHRAVWNHGSVVVKTPIGKSVDVKAFLQEAVLLERLGRHPHIIHFIGAVISETNLCLVLEFAMYGTLESVMCGSNRFASADLADQLKRVQIALDIAKGLAYLHREGVIHRDIACRNILLCNDYQAKINDFGMSRAVKADSEEGGKTSADIGPVKWMSPESLSNQTYSTKSDVWMFGILLYEMFARRAPYAEQRAFDIGVRTMTVGCTLELPASWPAQITDIMRSCWVMDPARRPTMDQIVDRLSQYYTALQQPPTPPPQVATVAVGSAAGSVSHPYALPDLKRDQNRSASDAAPLAVAFTATLSDALSFSPTPDSKDEPALATASGASSMTVSTASVSVASTSGTEYGKPPPLIARASYIPVSGEYSNVPRSSADANHKQ